MMKWLKDETNTINKGCVSSVLVNYLKNEYLVVVQDSVQPVRDGYDGAENNNDCHFTVYFQKKTF